MRVIAGRARRVRLDVVPESSARPFLEQARGALFNALGGEVPGAAALDVYAGSGALGIEALSRGAARCVFVEREPRSAAAIRDNLKRCKLEELAAVLQADAVTALGGLEPGFDLVFADPPFADARDWGGTAESARIAHETTRLLAPGGLLAFRYEHDDDDDAPAWEGLSLERDRRYGRSRVCLYRKAL